MTAEDDAYQNADATGDDLGKGIQDDGLITPLHAISTSDRSYTMDVTVTNQTGVRANLYGWIDFNKNGLFEVEEFAFVNVPSNSGYQVVTLNFNVPANVTLIPDHTFVRLRITTDTLAPGMDYRMDAAWGQLPMGKWKIIFWE